MKNKVVAIILGGGVGSRLYPLTKDRSKPAVPIAGKYRLIDIPISNCINSDIKKMFVLTMFNSASLNAHIKNTYHFDQFNEGFVDILAAEQTPSSDEWFLGTADAVRKTLKRINSTEFDYALILSGDQLYNMDFDQILKDHQSQKADITIATIPVNKQDATGFGIMKVTGEGEINDFVEKPKLDIVENWTSELDQKYRDQGKNYLASMGIYVFNRNALNELIYGFPNYNDFGKEIIPHSVKSEKYNVVSYAYDGYWADIGTISSFLKANLNLTGYLPEFNLYGNEKKVYTRARMLSPTKIFGTKITQGLISDGCICHASELYKCILGVRSRVGKDTVIKSSIVIGNSYYQTLSDLDQMPENELLGIGNDCYIENAIIDRNVRLGNGVSIIGDASLEDTETDTYCIREGIVIVKKGAYIPKYTKIGLIRT
jgi:glucose-1-phosphate adenylyltransferase